MARSLSLRLCRNEWMTHPVGTRGFNHLFSAALAEFELHFSHYSILETQILMEIKQPAWRPKVRSQPTEFAAGSTPVLSLRHGCSI